jgi:hypothetical protein
MSSRKGKRGVAVTGSWQPVPLDFLRSRAAAELSPHGAKLLLDVLAMLGPNAARNGDISLAPKLMRVRGWNSSATLVAAVRELEAHGLLSMTRQGSRLDCSLFACSLYPLDCELKKIDVKPGSYLTSDWMQRGSLAKPPDDHHPARWRRARKLNSVIPLRNETSSNHSATERTPQGNAPEIGTSFRHGMKSPVLSLSIVPPRDTYLDKPSIGNVYKPHLAVTHQYRPRHSRPKQERRHA